MADALIVTLERGTAMPTDKAYEECANWLRTCLKLGWRTQNLDMLEALWWKYHDDHGVLCAAR